MLMATSPRPAMGTPMRDQELRNGLNRLVRQFDRIAVPDHGRYVHSKDPGSATR
jgi:hypothetical protein